MYIYMLYNVYIYAIYSTCNIVFINGLIYLFCLLKQTLGPKTKYSYGTMSHVQSANLDQSPKLLEDGWRGRQCALFTLQHGRTSHFYSYLFIFFLRFIFFFFFFFFGGGGGGCPCVVSDQFNRTSICFK